MARKWFKRIGVFLAVILFLITALILFLHTSWGKTIVRSKVEKYLAAKLQTTLSFGAIDYRLPNWIRLKDVLILDRKHDTLLSGGNIYVRINMLKLLSQNVDIGGIELENIVAHVYREAGDSTFNFQFLTDAFDSGEPDAADTASKADPIRLSVHHFLLNNFRLTFNDKNEKQYFSAEVGHFYCTPNQLNPEKKLFSLNDLVTKGFHVTIVDSSIATEKPPEARNMDDFNQVASQELPSLFVELKKLGLKDVSFSYKKPSEKLDLSLLLDTMQVDRATFDLAKQTLSTNSVFLSNSAISASVWSNATASATHQQPAPQTDAGNSWNINVDRISLIDNSVAYHNMALPAQKGFDYNHIDAKHINFFASQNKTDENGFTADIDSCSLVINDQFHLKGLTTSISYSNSLLLIKDFAIALNQSRLNTTGELVWELKPGGSSPDKNLRCRVDNSVISYADVLAFQPQLVKTLPIALPSSGKLTLSGDLVSAHQNLSVRDLRLHSSNNNFAFAGNADIHNVTGKDGLTYKVDINELRVQKQLLSTDMLHKLENENIRLPNALTLTGRLNGTTNKTIADVKLNSEFGQLNIKGEANDITDLDRLKYDFVIDANSFETGKWINQDSVLGILNGRISIKGTGYQINKMAALCNLQLSSFVINAYNYSNIDLNGELNASEFTAKGKINDPNLDLFIDINGKLGHEYPDLAGVIDINRADLRALQFSKDSIVISNVINVDARNEGPGRMVATIRVDSSTLEINGKMITVDSLLVTGSSGRDSSCVSLKSPFLTAGLNANFPVAKLPDAIGQLQNRIYPKGEPGKIIDGKQRLEMNASLEQHDLLSTLIPDLELFRPLTVTGGFDLGKRDSFLFFRATSPAIGYNNLNIDQFLVSAESIDSTTTVNIRAENIRSGIDSLLQPSVSARLEQDLVTIAAGVKDSKGEEYYNTNATVQLAKDSTVIRLIDHLTINQKRWKVPADNYVVLVKDGFLVNNLSLSNRGQSISIASADPARLSPINISIDSIDIGQMLALLSFNDTAIAAGILQADISIQQPVKRFPIFTGNAEVSGLAYHNIPVGDFAVYSATAGDSLQMHGSVSGNNKVEFSGSIHKDNGDISGGLQLQKLDMNLIQEFVKDFISRASGNVTGDFRLSGTMKDPQCKGTIYFDSTAFAMKDFQALYRIDGQKITVDYPTIMFDHFSLSDTLNNKLTVNGTIRVNNPGELGLDLQADTKNFIALNARRRPESIIYGTAIIDAKMKIGGTTNSPAIEGNGYLHDKSSIHYIFTKNNDYTKAGKEGIRFVDIDTLAIAEIETRQTAADSAVRQRPVSGLMYNLNLEIGKDAEFSIIIDPTTNDELVLKGEGQLNTGIEEDGSMGITGIYRLRSGYYKMNNQFLKSTFTLAPGSTITFNGDPYNAEADVTTQYEVTTSSTGLLRTDESEMPGVTKRLPYLVILKIKGPISKPELSFDIRLKKDAISIDGSLKSAIEDELEKLRNDMSEINKQAFSLLVANRFTVTGEGDATASSFNPTTALSNGMSQFLTEAMNEVADDLIKGVDLEVDLKNYKRADDAETKTDIGVSVSKNYLDDRLIVTIGKNFTLGEDASSYQNNMQQYIPDVTTSYKLSKDGRYRVKAYQKNEYDTVVEGYFTETGVAFTIELDYNKFKELLQRSKNPDNQ